MRFAPALAICGLLACGSLAHAKSDLYNGWIRAETPEVILITNLPPGTATPLAAQYTVFRRSLYTLLAPPHRRLPPAILIVMDSEKLFKQAVMTSSGQGNLKSTSTALGTTQLMAISYDNRYTTLPLLYEFDVATTLPKLGYATPLWMAQGTGEVFSSCTINDRVIEIGGDNGPVNSASGHLAWPEFFSMGSGSSRYSGADADGAYQKQAWKLMHTLLLDGGADAMRERLAALDHAVRWNAPSATTVSAVLGVAPAQLDATISQHFRHLPKVTLPSHLAEITAAIHPVAMPRVEVQAYCAEIEERDGNPDQGDLDIDQAILAAPDDPIVNEAMAWRQMRTNDVREAVRYFQKAVEHGPTQAEDFYFAADLSLKDNGDTPGAGGPGIEPAISNLRQALKFDPSNPRIYVDLGRALYAARSNTQADADELLPGVGDDDEGLRVEYMRALLLRRAGNPAQAEAALHHVVDKSPNERVRQMAQTELFRSRIQADAAAVATLANAGRFDEALAVVDAGLKASDSDLAEANYGRLRNQVLEMRQVVDLVALYRHKEYEKFVAQAQAFIDAHPSNHNDDTLRDDIADAQNQIDTVDIKPLPSGALTKDQ